MSIRENLRGVRNTGSMLSIVLFKSNKGTCVKYSTVPTYWRRKSVTISCFQSPVVNASVLCTFLL